ncbi:MAG: dihydroorotate dehydrogenase, partial [Salinarimonas sp.]
NTPDAVAALAGMVGVPGVAAIEVSICCPNLEDYGTAFAMRPESTRELVRRLRDATALPLWAKLTPNAGDVGAVAQAAEAGGADALVVANTILAMSVDVATRRPSLGNVMGGLSGPAVKPIILRMAYQCARATTIPVIGCGGIATAKDALEFLIVGCRAVQVGTASFIHPAALIDVLEGLEAHCRAHGIARIEDVIGSLDLTVAERDMMGDAALEARA